jgi:hypothetical protein
MLWHCLVITSIVRDIPQPSPRPISGVLHYPFQISVRFSARDTRPTKLGPPPRPEPGLHQGQAFVRLVGITGPERDSLKLLAAYPVTMVILIIEAVSRCLFLFSCRFSSSILHPSICSYSNWHWPPSPPAPQRSWQGVQSSWMMSPSYPHSMTTSLLGAVPAA